jgi:hypothetical protein
MPMELQIIRAQEFIRNGVQGKVDFATSKEILATLARACRRRGINQALLDLRDVHFGPKPVFSPAELAALVNTFHEMGFTHQQRLAVLYRSDPHRRARLFTFVANMRGWRVQAFDSYELALGWLSETEYPCLETTTKATDRPVNIPVRNLRNLPASRAPATIEIKTQLPPKANRRANTKGNN